MLRWRTYYISLELHTAHHLPEAMFGLPYIHQPRMHPFLSSAPFFAIEMKTKCPRIGSVSRRQKRFRFFLPQVKNVWGIFCNVARHFRNKLLSVATKNLSVLWICRRRKTFGAYFATLLDIFITNYSLWQQRTCLFCGFQVKRLPFGSA